MASITIKFDNGEIYQETNKKIYDVFQVPDEGIFYQAVQDIYSGEWFDSDGRACPRSVTRRYLPSQPPEKRSLPSTMQEWIATPIGEFFPLTKEWQKFWLDMIDRATGYTLNKRNISLSELNENDLLYWWAYATQHSLAMTDNHSALNDGKVIPISEGGFADYNLKVNLYLDDGTPNKPIAKKSLGMTGNLYKQIGNAQSYIAVETLNAGYLDSTGKKLIVLPPPSLDSVWDKPWLIHWAVESTMIKLSNGSYVQSKFPPKPYGLPYPHMGIGTKDSLYGVNWVKPNRLARIQNGTVFSPYYP
jgi:hypothetical protein